MDTLTLDKQYIIPEMMKKQEREQMEKNNDVKNITTSLEKLGISSIQKVPTYNIVWGDNYKIKLFITDNNKYTELLNNKNIKCSW